MIIYIISGFNVASIAAEAERQRQLERLRYRFCLSFPAFIFLNFILLSFKTL